MDDVRGPFRRFAELQRLALRLHVPRIVGAPFDPGPAESHCPGAREPAELGRKIRPVHEVVETVGPCTERVLELVRPLHDAVAGAHLVRLLVLPCEPRPGEHEVDLLRCAVRVRGRRQHPGGHLHAIDAYALGAGGVPQAAPGCVHLPFRKPACRHLVPVDDLRVTHRSIVTRVRRRPFPPGEPRR